MADGGYATVIAADVTDAVSTIRKIISLANEGDAERLLELAHPDVEMSLKVRPGEPVRGSAELDRFLREFIAPRAVFEISLTSVDALDECRVIAQGRVRWMDDDRVLRDDPVVWAMVLEDGLLRRSTAVRSVSDAEALLASAPRPASA